MRIAVVILFILILIFAVSGVTLYTDWLWFDNLGYGSVILTVLASEWGLRVAAWAVFFLFLFFNLYYLRKALLDSLERLSLQEEQAAALLNKLVSGRKVTGFLALVSILGALFFATYMGGMWMKMRQFFQGVEFGTVDPIFGRDASFYVFELPFLSSVYTFLQMTVIVTLVLVGLAYFVINPPVQVGKRFVLLPHRGVGHLSFLLALSFLLKAWDYRLQMYELLMAPRGFVQGPGYTEINANLPALWILFFLALVLAGLLVYNIYRQQSRFFLWSIGILVVVSLTVGSIYPALLQQFRVEPNQFAYERPYIEHNIQFTLEGFGLNEVRTEDYPAHDDLDWSDLDAAEGTLQNVRLWDYRPLEQTFNQLQGIRPYYLFVDVDTDRYHLGDEYRQVMLSLRELNQNQLPEQAQTWVNLNLQYTHGYGLAMTTVADVGPQGLPEFTVQDIPPHSETGLEIDRPEIYYGEISPDYVIANTRTPEFSYPRGGENVYAHYEGTGGVPLGSLSRQVLYALRFGDYRIAISDEIQQGSRIMYNRRIRNRAMEIAPFLSYDEDPYPVVADGRIFWIIDAYTTTDNFPYSQAFQGLNYIRNSVKVVVDAYNGDVSFYVIEPEDALAQTYANIFPDLFKPVEEMPEELFKHIRYPERLLSLQGRVYATYHMTNPVVFYNREDLWEIPNERYFGASQPMEPYYNILQLPGLEEPEFVLMQPFTPARRDNMIAWMAGRCDGENYGELLVYLFPKDRMTFGPMQIETRIDQNTLISQQLALWDQRGSRVIRGNLLVLPVEGSVIYVEPIFLQAEDSELPELGRVVVGFGDEVVMEPTLQEGLEAIFGLRGVVPDEELITLPEGIDPEDIDPEDYPEVIIPTDVSELAAQAQEIYDEAHERMKEGDWAGYGEKMEELEEKLLELKRLTGRDPDAPDEEELLEEELMDEGLLEESPQP